MLDAPAALADHPRATGRTPGKLNIPGESMRFKLSPVVGALALATGILAATNVAAVRFQPLENSDVLVTPAKMPLGINTAQTTVVVQLAADPVAVAQANAGRKLSKQEKEQIKARLKGAQNGLRGSIEGLGGKVLGTYQSAYNGMKVRIAGDKAGKLAELPGVVAVRSLQLMRPDNVHGVPLIGAPGVWQSLGLHGEGIKIAVIDTGIDYTHANFGGPGTVAAYEAAHASESSAADPALFGPSAPRVKGGVDLAGDDYDADPQSDTYQPVPHPDPNPLDCNGHGSHVAGSAAGSGVTDDGATFAGPYNASTVANHSWNIGPGVAPKADLYAVRVFGCNGSTDLTVDAIEWAVDNEMDVINMSLGSPFGSKDDPSAAATTNAAKAGVVVVTSAGNSGPNQYITGSPGTAVGAIATAAIDPTPDFPGATIALADGVTMTAINANGHDFAAPLTGLTVKVLTDNPATPDEDESLGCSVAAFGSLPANTMAVVNRGVCARVAKAIFGEQAGARVVVMVNNATTLPPFEGKITSNPDDGTPFVVTIPFLGVRGGAPVPPTSDGGKLQARDGMGATVTPVLIPNPNFAGFGDFSSGGPRTGDSALKPDIAAPGVSIVSTLSGGGNAGTTISGTSMASPHVAGVAALTRQAHPTWSVEDIKAAIVNTGSPASVAGYRTSRAGTGLVQPAGSTASQVVALANDEKFTASLNFGFAELTKDYKQTKTIKLRNNGSTPATFDVAAVLPSGSSHSTALDKSNVTVGPGANATVSVTLSVPAATAGAANGSGLSFREVAGIVQFTPASASDNGGVALRVPYYLVPRPRSDVSTSIGRLEGTNPEAIATVTNKHGVIDGDADFYAWGLSSKKEKGDLANDVRAVGVQSFPFTATEQLVVFAVNTYTRWSNPSTNEFDISVDVDGDGTDDYIVVGADQGAVQTGVFNGRMGSFVFSTRSAGASLVFLASAPTDSSTALLPVRTAQLCRAGEPCLNAANPRMTYRIVSFDVVSEAAKAVDGVAKFNAWSSSISTGGFATVSPGGSDASNTIAVDPAEWALTPALGLMVVTLDNANGESQAQLIPVKVKK
jgi:subtilisin family serine protease